MDIYKIIFLFFTLLNYIDFCYAQEYSLKNELSATKIDKMTSKELDSMFSVLKDYTRQGFYEKVIEFGPDLIRRATFKENINTALKTRGVLGYAFLQLNQIDNAYNEHSKALEIAKNINDSVTISTTYIDLGNVYLDNDYNRSKFFYEKALAIGSKTRLADRITYVTYNNLAEMSAEHQRYDEAQKYLNKARLLLDNHKIKKTRARFQAMLNYIQSYIYLGENKPELVISIMERSINSIEKELDRDYIIKSYKMLMDAYEQTVNYEGINKLRKKHQDLLDEKYEQEKIRQEKIASARYNLESYKLQLSESQLKNELASQIAKKRQLLLIVFAIVGFAALMLLLFLLYARRKRSKLLSNLKAKNQLYLEAKEESERLGKAKTKFLSTISHELRTPMYGIIGLTSVFLKDPKLKDYSDDFNSLKFSADYLLSLVNDVLIINKNNSKVGKNENNSNFEIYKILKNIVENFQTLNTTNNNEVKIIMDTNVPKVVFADKTKISQVLINLVSNASKFTKNGLIEIGVNLKEILPKKAHLFFSVTDNGIGISKEEYNNVFKEFTQIHTASNSQKGTGLGLSIVNAIVKNLGGKLKLESEEGKGSEFSFDLWLAINQDLNTEKEVANQIDFEKLKNKKVLVVDDNKINQLVTCKILKQYGVTCTLANDGVEAVENTSNNAFDAILMDINMPKMNGLEASEKIREFNTKIPIVALTASQTYKINDIKKHGINHCIFKPYKNEDMLHILLELID